MKTFKILLLALFISANAQAAVTSIDEVMNVVDQKNISTMEQLLPELPEDLRANFTLVHQSKSLQAASMQKPRVIMYGKDGEFIAAFNGDANANGFNKLEMIQYNKTEKRFDFFELAFPIARDSTGKAVRPQRNPALCLTCHGTNPHPIWNSYNNWPGAYGAFDDFLEGQELATLEAFLGARRDMARYTALSPLQGSNISPFSYEKRGNMKFRPNLRMGQFAAYLQSTQLAANIRKGGQFDRYAALMMYEVDRGITNLPEYNECPSLTSGKPVYNGMWTPEDAKKLHVALETERQRIAPQGRPIPEKWHIVNDLHVLYHPKSTPGDWSLSLETADTKTTVFQHGDGPISWHVLGALSEDFYRVIPEIKPLITFRSRYEETSKNQRLVRTPFDLEHLRTLDRLPMRVGFKTEDRCPILLAKIKRDWIQ